MTDSMMEWLVEHGFAPYAQPNLTLDLVNSRPLRLAPMDVIRIQMEKN